MYSLCTDKDGFVWAGTAVGLSRYNIVGNNFTNYYFHDKYPVSVFNIQDLPTKNSLLLSTDMGLVVFNKQSGNMSFISRLRNIVIFKSCKINEIEILLGTVDGTWIYNIETNQVKRVIPSLQSKCIIDVLYDPKRHLYWLASQGNGLFKVNEKFQIDNKYFDQNELNKLNSNKLKELWLDSDGKVWIGSMDGLFIFNVESNNFDHYTFSYEDDSSLSHNSVRTIFQDQQGGIWIGTYFGGLCYYHSKMPFFKILRRSENYNSLSNNIVNCIVEDPYSKNLWIGTNDGGLNLYNRKTQKIKYYQFGKDRSSLSSNHIKHVFVDENRDVYIGTVGGGLNCIYADGHVEHFIVPNAMGGLNSCYYFFQDNDHSLWVGTAVGLFLFDKNKRRLIEHPLVLRFPQLSNTLIRSCYKDSRGDIWICTDKKLYVYDGNNLVEKKYITPNGKAENISAWSVLETKNHLVWIASSTGLYKYSFGNSFTLYTMVDGLLNDYINCLLEDERGRLWVTTNKGISCFNPQTSVFLNYTQQDGLSSNQFNPGGACKTYDGFLYLGSLNGITSFKPSQLKDNTYIPQPIITGFSVMNHPVFLQNDKNISLRYSSDGLMTGVSFPSDMKTFSINFTAVNYLTGDRNRFAYRLKGFSDEWIYPNNEELKVDYSNLSPGKYVFQVKACNDIGQWNEHPTDFLIHITPMWYESLWFKILIIICILCLISFFIYYKISRAKIQMQLQLEHLKREKAEELSQEKVRFYINISHELRTPLSLILAPLGELMELSKEWDGNIRKKMNYIFRNSYRLLHIVNQLLEFRRAETGLLALNVSENYIDKIVYSIFEMFQEKADKKNINFSFINNLKGIMFPIDKMYLETIVMNLLSNAFKFTPNGKTIEVEVFKKEDFFYIRVKDTGIGIPLENQQRIFERFYQIDDNKKGSGIGLSLVKCLIDRHHGLIELRSDPNCFTEFLVGFPISALVYDKKELSGSDKIEPSDVAERLVEFESNLDFDNLNESQIEEEQNNDICEKKYTLLVVDDNKEMLCYLKDCFESQYIVLTAINGEDAINVLKANQIDVILSDVMMPGIDGVKLCQLVKRNLQTCHIPFILLSAKGDVIDQEAGIQMGADDYIPKPFSSTLLKGKIANVIKSRERYIHYYTSTIDIDSAKMTSNPIDEEFIAKAVRIVEENLDNEDFSIEDLAEHMYMGRTSLYNKMNAIVGEAPANFIRRIRFNKACKMILEGKLTIAEISIQTGFRSASYFSSSFKRYVGCLPSEYINKEKNGEVQ